jgi:predicted nucleotidyltransferase
MKFGLNEETITAINLVFSKYPEIQEVIIYGSRAKGCFREGSDIDITLKGDQITDEICAKIWLDIDELNLPYLFDISVYQLLETDSLLDHISRVGKCFYKSN